MYRLLLLGQVLLVIFEAFVNNLIPLPRVGFNGNISLSKALRTISLL